MRRSGTIRIEVSPGELIDRLTILRIKDARMTDPRKLANVRAELLGLDSVYRRSISPSPELEGLIDRLRRVNELLWEAEDEVRGCEAAHDFGGHFASHARSIYRLNDERAALKRQINVLLGSRLMEEKAHGVAVGGHFRRSGSSVII